MFRKIQKRVAQGGFIVTIELLLISTILVLGLIVGMVSVRDAVLSELSDVSESIGALNQSYNILGVNNAAQTAGTSGSAWQDYYDTNAGYPIDVTYGAAQYGDADAEFYMAPVNYVTSETEFPYAP